MPNVLFSPGIKFLNKFKYPVKIGIISVVLILFIGGLFYIVTQHIENVIKSTEKQIIGLHYIDPVKNFLQDVQEHRALTTAYLNGEKQLKNEIIEKNKKIQKDIDSVKKVQKEKKSILNIDKKWTQISNEWQYLENNSLNLTSEENFKKHTNLINEILNLIEDIGDLSGLILDSQLNTFYMARSISRNIPELVEYVGEARSFGIGIVTRKKITERERTDLIIQATLIKDNLRRINQNFLIIFSTDKIIKEKVERFLDDITTSTNYFLNMINKELINTDKITISRKDFYMTGAAAINSTYRLYEIELHELEYLLTERINKLKQGKSILFSAVSVALLGLIYIFACFSIALLDSLKTLEETELNIARGNLDAEAAVYSKYDEMGSLSMAFNSMMKNLKMLMEREVILREIILSSLESRNKNQILRSIVDNTGRIFKADRCFFVEYDDPNDATFPIKEYEQYRSSDEVRSHLEVPINKESVAKFVSSIRQKQIVIANNIYDENLSKESKEMLIDGLSVKSYLIAPVFYRDYVYGSFVLHYVNEFKTFTGEDVDFAAAVANQAAVMLKQNELFEKEREAFEREKENKNLIEIMRSSMDKSVVKKLFVKNIGKFFKADRVFICEYSLKNKKLLPIDSDSEYLAAPDIKSFIGIDFADGNYVNFHQRLSEKGEVLIPSVKEFLNTDKVSDEEIKLLSAGQTKSSYSFPVVYEDKLIATFTIDFVQNEVHIKNDEIARIRKICAQLGIALDHAHLYQKAQECDFFEKSFRNEVAEKIKEPTNKILDNSTLLLQNEFERNIQIERLNSIIGSCNCLMELTKVK